MGKIIYKYQQKKQLDPLLEGYLYGLGEVCHTLFGPKGEVAMYQAIGSFFLAYLKNKMNITFEQTDPWLRHNRIIEVFTSYGFYSYVELEKISENKYWMSESGQYAGNVWDEQKAWERGTPPCPLWSIILHSLSEIEYTIVLDNVSFCKETNGYESTFHFERIAQTEIGVIESARKEIRTAMLPICASCKKIRNDDDQWKDMALFFTDHFDTKFTHSICPACAKKLYPDFKIYD